MPEATLEQAPPTTQTSQAPDAPEIPDAFSQLDSLINQVEPPKTESKPEEPKKDQAPTGKEEAKVEPPKDKPKVEEKKDEPQVQAEPPKGTAKELRTALENTKKELAAARSELEKVKKAPKADDPEKKTILERLQAEEKRRQEIESELKFANYEKTPEYEEKYVKPMKAAFDTAYKELEGYPVKDADGNETKASAEHFNALLNMPSGKAALQAREWFGDLSVEVLAHRRRILEMNENRKLAIDDFRKQGGEREKQMQIERAARAEKEQELWRSSIEEQVQKYPQFFGPEEGDEQGNSILEKGYQVADLVFSGADLPPEKKVKLHATVRNKAGAFDRVAFKYKQAQDKIAALEKELADFKKSEPSTDKGNSDSTNIGNKSWEQDWDAMFNK